MLNNSEQNAQARASRSTWSFLSNFVMKLRFCSSNFQAEHLCNIMSEFDPRSEFLKMRVDPKEKVLSMAAKSNILQEFAVDVPSQSDIVQSFQVRMTYLCF